MEKIEEGKVYVSQSYGKDITFKVIFRIEDFCIIENLASGKRIAADVWNDAEGYENEVPRFECVSFDDEYDAKNTDMICAIEEA